MVVVVVVVVECEEEGHQEEDCCCLGIRYCKTPDIISRGIHVLCSLAVHVPVRVREQDDLD